MNGDGDQNGKGNPSPRRWALIVKRCWILKASCNMQYVRCSRFYYQNTKVLKNIQFSMYYSLAFQWSNGPSIYHSIFVSVDLDLGFVYVWLFEWHILMKTPPQPPATPHIRLAVYLPQYQKFLGLLRVHSSESGQ